MSHIQNEVWLEGAFENFQNALDAGNYALVKDVIADTEDAGFEAEARVMENKLRGYPLTHFGHPSPYKNL